MAQWSHPRWIVKMALVVALLCVTPVACLASDLQLNAPTIPYQPYFWPQQQQDPMTQVFAAVLAQVMDNEWKKCKPQLKTTIDFAALGHDYLDPILQSLDDDARARIMENVQTALEAQKDYSTQRHYVELYNAMKNDQAIPKESLKDYLQRLHEAYVANASQKDAELRFSDEFKIALKVGFMAGIMECTKRVMSEALVRVVKRIPNGFSFLGHLWGKFFDMLCKRPEPIMAEELQIWETTFEGIVTTLCEQSASGNLMLRNVRVSDDDQEVAADANWVFFVGFVKEVLGHIGSYLQERLPHYDGSGSQRTFFVGFANSVFMENKTSIAFLMKVIVTNLQHIVAVCEEAENADEMDIAHVKKLARTTLLLFRKLRILLEGQPVNNGGSALIPTINAGMATGAGGSLLDF